MNKTYEKFAMKIRLSSENDTIAVEDALAILKEALEEYSNKKDYKRFDYWGNEIK